MSPGRIMAGWDSKSNSGTHGTANGTAHGRRPAPLKNNVKKRAAEATRFMTS